MTITETHATQVTKYLVGAGGMSAVEDQGAVWADMINAPINEGGCPDARPEDLIPAARLTLHRWATEGRSWKVDLPRYIQSLRALHRRRLDEYKAQHGNPYPEGNLSGEEYVAWLVAARKAITAGATTPQEVNRAAYAAVGMSVPALAPTHSHNTQNLKIGKQL